MATEVTVTLDEAAVAALIDRCAENGAQVSRQRARSIIMSEGRVNTGRMAEDINVTRLGTGSAMVAAYQVSADTPYAVYQEEGRGPVRPVRAKALRFSPKRSGKIVFSQYAGPVSGIHFMRRAADSLTASDFRSI